MAWNEEQKARSGEFVGSKKLAWRLSNQKRLKSAFPKAEQRFCKVIDKLCSHLNGSCKSLLRYQRQKLFSIDSEICFYVDFYFKAWKLAVEIDGDSHSSADAKEKDRWREAMISSNGILFLRFHNNRIETDDWWNIEDDFLRAVFSTPERASMKTTLRNGLSSLSSRGRPS